MQMRRAPLEPKGPKNEGDVTETFCTRWDEGIHRGESRSKPSRSTHQEQQHHTPISLAQHSVQVFSCAIGSMGFALPPGSAHRAGLAEETAVRTAAHRQNRAIAFLEIRHRGWQLTRSIATENNKSNGGESGIVLGANSKFTVKLQKSLYPNSDAVG